MVVTSMCYIMKTLFLAKDVPHKFGMHTFDKRKI